MTTDQPSPTRSSDSSFLKTLSTLERLCNIRCRLLETSDLPFECAIIDHVIMGKVMELHALTTSRCYSDMKEGNLLTEVERIVEVRKTLANASYPIEKTLKRLDEMINETILCLDWEREGESEGDGGSA